jgi:glycosyltransferase involved in cell wall biosynthesis
MKIFELAACGVPILASNIKGHLDLKIFDLGIIYYKHDDFNDFRDKLSLLISNKDLRLELKEKSLKNIEQLSFENRTKLILDCVRSSIG